MGSINCKNFSSTSDTHDNRYDEYIEEAVCHVDDIANNEMKEFEINKNYKVLLVNQFGNITATGTKCSHYGAPLITGVLGDGHIKCPWHGACFNTTTGDIEDFPGLDSIPCYNVKIDDNKVIVRAKKLDLENNKRIKPMTPRNKSNENVFVIIGGGPAGGVCAETLRQEGFTGRIILICRERALPYDRVKLTKAMNIALDKLEYRTAEFYASHSIEIMYGISVTKVNASTKTVTCSNGDSLKYDKVFIASGSEPIRIPLPESDKLENVMTIRNHVDVQKIDRIVTNETNVVFLGSGFISLEAASYCVKTAKSVTIVFRGEAPLQHSFGKEIGSQILKLFEENGVQMLPHNDITKCIGKDGKINKIELQSEETILCDLLIMGVGARPCTNFLHDSGITINSIGSIDTDMHLMAKNCEDVYVGGDIANAPIFSSNNRLSTIGHYQIAQYHGKIAAANMVGNVTRLHAVPFFWTQLFGKSFRYAGYGSAYDMEIKGNLNTYEFVAFFMDKQGNINSVATCNKDPIASQFAEFLHQGRKLHRNDISENPFQWVEQLNKK